MDGPGGPRRPGPIGGLRPRPQRDPLKVGRGTNPAGVEDEHPTHAHVDLPPADPAYRPPDLGARIDKLLHDDAKPHRTQTLFPYLFIRAVPGDHGARPLWEPIVCWESCDIHLMPAGAGPFDFTQTVLQPVAGETYRVFVHVWNLGRMAAYGARLRAWWVEPGFFRGTPGPQYQPQYIGGTWLDLGDRDSGEAHRVVEIPTPWTVVMNNEAHECLLAAVECASDPWDGVLDANGHRHVAQRNLNLVAGAASAAHLVAILGRGLPRTFRSLQISRADVSRASLLGARERGLAGKGDARGDDARQGYVPGPATPPLLELRRGARGGLQVVSGPDLKTMSVKELPALLAGALGVGGLTGAEVEKQLGGPALIRFAVTDAKGTSGGYSILFTA